MCLKVTLDLSWSCFLPQKLRSSARQWNLTNLIPLQTKILSEVFGAPIIGVNSESQPSWVPPCGPRSIFIPFSLPIIVTETSIFPCYLLLHENVFPLCANSEIYCIRVWCWDDLLAPIFCNFSFLAVHKLMLHLAFSDILDLTQFVNLLKWGIIF